MKLPKVKSRVNLLCAAVLLLSTSVLIGEAYALFLWQAAGRATLPWNFGNTERVRSMLPPPAGDNSFSFAVAGDIRQGIKIFKHIGESLADEPLSFLVLLGDAAVSGNEAYHHLLRYRLAQDLVVPFPVFYVVGNHDVSPGGFTVERFVEEYGPTRFYFEHAGSLFICLQILRSYSEFNEGRLDFLEKTLAAHRSRCSRAFVFIHMPPPVTPDISGPAFKGSERFVRLCNDYGVDYVVTGDYHGYSRATRGKTSYLISGGGGASLTPKKFGSFHHAVVVTVTPDSVSERILAVGERDPVNDRIAEMALGKIAPWMKEHPAACLALNIGLIAAAAGAIRFWMIGRQRPAHSG